MTIHHISKSSAQAMIAMNKVRIKDLEVSKAYSLHMINEHYWPNSNPNSRSYGSQIAFLHLNQHKDDVRAIKKELKVLAEMQRFLKSYIRN